MKYHFTGRNLLVRFAKKRLFFHKKCFVFLQEFDEKLENHFPPKHTRSPQKMRKNDYEKQ